MQPHADSLAVRAQHARPIVAAQRRNQLDVRAEQREIRGDVPSNAARRHAHNARIGIAQTRLLMRKTADIDVRAAEDRNPHLAIPRFVSPEI